MAERQLTAQERAINFQIKTRKTIQTLPSQKVAGENQTVEFLIPKVRLMSKILIEVQATVNIKATAGTAVAKSNFSPYEIFRRVSLDLNNGFSPYVLPGRDLYLYNINRLNPEVLEPSTNERGLTYVGNSASAAGTDNKIKFVIELASVLNERDPIGLLLLQNPETQLTLQMDLDKMSNAYKLNASNGETVTFKDMTITPVVETFTIPAEPAAMPDISVLKIVQSKAEQFSGMGQHIAILNTGQIYRRLVLYFEDEQGNPLKDSDFAGNIELIFNQADIPISIKPSILSSVNASLLGRTLPDGMFVFDFASQGLPNIGGTRDYVDTERLTEFTCRFTTTKKGKVTSIAETLSRLT